MQEKQNCSHKTWHIGIEIVSNESSKKRFVSLLRKNLFFLFYIKCFGLAIFRLGEKKYIVKNEKWIAIPESQYVNLNPDVYI